MEKQWQGKLQHFLNEKIDRRAIAQRAVLRDCGSKPADNAVGISKLQSRRKFSGSRHYAKPPPRCMQPADRAVGK